MKTIIYSVYNGYDTLGFYKTLIEAQKRVNFLKEEHPKRDYFQRVYIATDSVESIQADYMTKE